jgi:hypothetical protein
MQLCYLKNNKGDRPCLANLAIAPIYPSIKGLVNYMSENQATSLLQDIRIDLDTAISQLRVLNSYVDSEGDDPDLSNSMIGLTQSLSSIATRLHQYQSQAIAAKEGGATNGN